MKKAKIFSAISLIMLCFCLMGFGIVALNAGNHNVGTGGIINIPANKIGVTVKAYIIQGIPTAEDYAESVTPDYDSSLSSPTVDANGKETSCGEVWQFTNKQLQSMAFNFKGANTDEDLQNIQVTIVFVIKNNGELNLKTKYTLSTTSQDSITEQMLTVEETVNGTAAQVDTVAVTLNNTTIAGNSQSDCSIVFKPTRYVDSVKTASFNYTLNILDENSTFPEGGEVEPSVDETY